MSNWQDYLNLFLETPSVVGSERPFILRLQQTFEQMGLKTDSHLGILAVHGSQPDSNYLSIHIDRHGLFCTGPNEFQYAAFISRHSGDRTRNSVSRSTYLTLLDRFLEQEVFAYEPWSGEYIGSGVINKCFYCPHRDNAIFKLSGLEHMPVGVPISYSNKLSMNGDLVSSQLDNVLLAAVVADLFARGYQGTALFTCEEEAGKSWYYIKQYFAWRTLTPKNLLVLDTSPYDVRENAEVQDIVLRNCDANARFSKLTTNQVVNACKKLDLNYSFKDEYIKAYNDSLPLDSDDEKSLGRTELGRLIVGTDGQLNGTTIQIPTTDYHTSTETANVHAIEACLKLLSELVI